MNIQAAAPRSGIPQNAERERERAESRLAQSSFSKKYSRARGEEYGAFYFHGVYRRNG